MKIRTISSVILFGLFVSFGTSQTYDHLTITADSLVSHITPLCNFLESNLGLNDTIVTINEVYASSLGRDNQEKIRNFIKQAYTNWGVTHVLLAGDNEQIPCRLIWVEINTEWRDWIPTELYYSALDGDWDADGDNNFGEEEDSVDMLPDVFLGRVPLATPLEMDRFVDRFLIYASDSTASYLADVLFAGFDFSSTYFGEYACELYDTLLRPSSIRSWKVYDSHQGYHEDSVKYYLNQGMNIWLQYDHCNFNVMGCGYINHGWLIWNYELAQLQNAPRYGIMFAVGCYPSAFDSTDCVSEVLLTAPNGGCVATGANSRVGFGVNPDIYRSGSMFYVEKSLEGFWTHGGHSSLEAIAAAQAQAAAFAETNVVWRWCHFEFLLCGEPAMPVWVPSNSSVEEFTKPSNPKIIIPTIMREVFSLNAEKGTFIDISGRKVMDLHSGKNDVRNLTPGIYFLVLGEQHDRTVAKVIKIGKE